MAAPAIRFFDCNATVGRPSAPTFGSWLSSRGLLAEMDQFGIDEALIAHIYAQELDGSEGNQHTLSAASSSARLHAQATLVPRFGPRADAKLGNEIDGLVAASCLAVRLHPNPTHQIMDEAVYARQYELTPAVVDPILDALERRRLPLFVELAQTNWRELTDICRAYSDLPVVATNVSYTHKRSLFALLDAFPNFFCDTSCFHAYRGIEEVCDSFGPGHLLFGTRAPTFNLLAGKALVSYAEIDDGHKAAIAGGNLRRLLRLPS